LYGLVVFLGTSLARSRGLRQFRRNIAANAGFPGPFLSTSLEKERVGIQIVPSLRLTWVLKFLRVSYWFSELGNEKNPPQKGRIAKGFWPNGFQPFGLKVRGLLLVTGSPFSFLRCLHNRTEEGAFICCRA